MYTMYMYVHVLWLQCNEFYTSFMCSYLILSRFMTGACTWYWERNMFHQHLQWRIALHPSVTTLDHCTNLMLNQGQKWLWLVRWKHIWRHFTCLKIQHLSFWRKGKGEGTIPLWWKKTVFTKCDHIKEWKFGEVVLSIRQQLVWKHSQSLWTQCEPDPPNLGSGGCLPPSWEERWKYWCARHRHRSKTYSCGFNLWSCCVC